MVREVSREVISTVGAYMGMWVLEDPERKNQAGR